MAQKRGHLLLTTWRQKLSRENSFLFRVPLLDAKQHVIGYGLACQNEASLSETCGGSGADQLLALLAGRASDIKSGLFFVAASRAGLSDEVLQTLSPQTTVLVLKPSDQQGQYGSFLPKGCLHKSSYTPASSLPTSSASGWTGSANLPPSTRPNASGVNAPVAASKR